MTDLHGAFEQIVGTFASLFTAPTARSFQTIVLGWVLCQGSRTVSGVIRAAGWQADKSHDAYQNFFSKAHWAPNVLWERLFLFLVEVFSLTNKPIFLAGDDTITKHWGRRKDPYPHDQPGQLVVLHIPHSFNHSTNLAAIRLFKSLLCINLLGLSICAQRFG